jgi:hypothetical protein
MTELTKTLVFNLAIESDDATVLNDATRKARTVYNKTIEYYFETSGCDGLASGGVKPPTTTHTIA